MLKFSLQRFIGMIYQNSNESSGMQEVLQQIQENYVPSSTTENEVKFARLGVVGD